MTAAGATVRRRRARARPRLRAMMVGWGFSAPFVILFGVFLLVPIVASLLLAFTSFGIGNIQSWSTAEFVGLDNFTKLFSDDLFLKSVRNTAYFVVVGVPLTVIGALLLAVALNQGIGKLRAVFRVGYYLPVVTSIVAIAVIWRYLLEPDVGLLNTLLGKVGIGGHNWLGDPSTMMPSIIALGVWRNVGQSMVIFLAALQTVDPQLYDAAKVDGAKPRQMFRHITVPMLKPAILFVAVITSIGYLQVFEEPFVMTGPSGGTQQAAFTTSMYVYREGFNSFNLGYASAVAYALFTAIVVLAILQFRFLRSDDR
jgi:ABC-type sugar transport system permease subunit